MKFEDKGFLVNKNKYNENSIIAEFFTENNGKVSGIIFGATSTKIKNCLRKGPSKTGRGTHQDRSRGHRSNGPT